MYYCVNQTTQHADRVTTSRPRHRAIAEHSGHGLSHSDVATTAQACASSKGRAVTLGPTRALMSQPQRRPALEPRAGHSAAPASEYPNARAAGAAVVVRALTHPSFSPPCCETLAHTVLGMRYAPPARVASRTERFKGCPDGDYDLQEHADRAVVRLALQPRVRPG